MSAQVKSRQRVADHGEVFTAEREVKAMCDLVDNECNRIDSRFLEPACGDGNFLTEVLLRKLACSEMNRYKKLAFDWERMSLLALGSLYGVDILADNAQLCRRRLYDIWEKEYTTVCKSNCNEDTKKSARFILEQNIVCGNALTLMCVDEQQQDTNEPIVFSEWTLPFDNAMMQRKDYTMAELLSASEQEDHFKKTGQLSILSNEDGEVEPTLKKEWKLVHYRRLWDND
ncbi:MAG: DNA methyltransferase [Eubacteriales bacterium]|jgi:hypothetical protein